MSLECKILLEFRDFLKKYASDREAGGGIPEVYNCMTRNNTETYAVCRDELDAEILMAAWKYLHNKHFPWQFQQGILQSVLQIKVDLSNQTNTTINTLDLQKSVISELEQFLVGLSDSKEVKMLKKYAAKGALCERSIDVEADMQWECNCILPSQSITLPTYAVAALKNKRRKMEDRHICMEYYSEIYMLPISYSFYAVCDGHGGALAASYTVSQLPYILAEELKMQIHLRKLSVADYRHALEGACLKTDRLYRNKQLTSGTTVVCALIEHRRAKHDQLYVAWVGDSKALLVGAKASLQLVKSHKPDSLEERQRIDSTPGGSVLLIDTEWRVNGILNISRSIGDESLPAVIAEPDFVDVELNAAYDFLVLGTDGLFDHLTERTLTKVVYGALNDLDKKVEDIPAILIDIAKRNGSQDNITVVIVLLKSRAQIVDKHMPE